MQLAGGNKRRYAAMHVVGDPTERVLSRRVFTDGRMRVRVDQPRDCGNAVGIDGLIRSLIQTVANGLDETVLHENRVRLFERVFSFYRHQRADVLDQQRRHGRTIPNGPKNKKSYDHTNVKLARSGFSFDLMKN